MNWFVSSRPGMCKKCHHAWCIWEKLAIFFFSALIVPSTAVPCSFQNKILQLSHPDVQVEALPQFDSKFNPRSTIKLHSYNNKLNADASLNDQNRQIDMKGFYAAVRNSPVFWEETVYTNPAGNSRQIAIATQSCQIRHSCIISPGMARPLPATALDRTHELDDVIILGPIRWGDGFYHYMTEQFIDLTLFSSVLRSNPNVKIAFEMHPGHGRDIDILNAFNFTHTPRHTLYNHIILTSGVPYVFHTIYYPSGSWCGSPSRERLCAARESVPRHPPAANLIPWPDADVIGKPWDGASKLILYATRSGASRNILNEAAVVQTIQRAYPQHTIVRLDHKSQWQTAAKTIHLLQHAALIVSPHGAGLANILFAPSGTYVVEITPATMYTNGQGNFNWCYAIMAAALGQHHILFPVAGSDHHYTAPVPQEDLYRLLHQHVPVP